MPRRCAPWPVNSTATFRLPRTTPRSPPTGCPPPASSANAARASSRSCATNAARHSKADRVVASEYARSSTVGALSKVDSRLAACARTASQLLPDNNTGTGPAATPGSRSCTGASGACSMIACALVPLSPNEDTPARRGRSWAGHSCASVSSRTPPSDQSTLDDGSSTCRVLGRTPCRIAITILMTPATPAAAWVWLMFDFTEPSRSGLSSSRLRP